MFLFVRISTLTKIFCLYQRKIFVEKICTGEFYNFQTDFDVLQKLHRWQEMINDQTALVPSLDRFPKLERRARGLQRKLITWKTTMQE